MSAASQGNADPGTGPHDGKPTQSQDGPPARAPWLDELKAMLQELPGLLGDRAELLALELQRAGSALAQVVAWLVVGAILGVTAWLALWVGVGGLMVAAGLHWSFAVLVVLTGNLLAAVWALQRVRRLARRVALPATARHFAFGAPMPGDESGAR